MHRKTHIHIHIHRFWYAREELPNYMVPITDYYNYIGFFKTSFTETLFCTAKNINVSFCKTGQDEDRRNRCLGYWWLSRNRKSLRGEIAIIGSKGKLGTISYPLCKKGIGKPAIWHKGGGLVHYGFLTEPRQQAVSLFYKKDNEFIIRSPLLILNFDKHSKQIG